MRKGGGIVDGAMVEEHHMEGDEDDLGVDGNHSSDM